MKLSFSNVLLGVFFATASLSARANLELVDKNACLNCHAVDKKLVGPSFKDIAEKYKDRKDAVAYLSEKMIKGSSDVWGKIPMPAMPQLSTDDVKVMSEWIMKQPEKK
jgi:cytochrome c